MKLCWFLTILFLVAANLGEAQQPTKIPTIGWLSTRPASVASGRESLRRELSALGYVEGKNIAFEYRTADDRRDLLPALANDLVSLKIDVLIAPTTAESLVAKNATRTIPIVFMNAGDPVAARLVDSFSRPGGNITGFTPISPVIVGKRLEILKEAVPKLTRVAVVWDPKSGSSVEWDESHVPARALGLQLHSIDVSSADKYAGALKEAMKAGNNAVAVTLNSLAVSNQKKIIELAATNHLPTIYPRRDFVEGGGLMSYGANQDEVYKRVAAIVDKILKGTKPADIPVEQPTKFEFVANVTAAKQIGFTIPPNVLARADRVIK